VKVGDLVQVLPAKIGYYIITEKQRCPMTTLDAQCIGNLHLYARLTSIVEAQWMRSLSRL
jgi:hypothetical protein